MLHVVEMFNRTTARWEAINDGYTTHRSAEEVAVRLYIQLDRKISFRVVQVEQPADYVI